ncbi:PAS domain-containing protein [Rhizobacter sp. SG703]|uniref:sensor domain-containing protein n=1 Tax=Rhizobacter sp. SG703 TaxID=2587140 RepID=UPI00182E7CF0|nr:PAS domain-containing protein [Rhizobacter sp. SG703]NKI97579.1 diguanylate cyclase (GGDEF)-like protein/PAS domain S-box-containing protein [Rhizobacter sp. SG703]
MRESALSTARVGGVVVGLFGAAMATHWVFPVDAVAHLVPGLEHAGIVGPLLFVAAGLCLFNASRPSTSATWLTRLAALCVGALVALPLAYLFENASGIGLGIDIAHAGAVPTATHPYPGRLSPNASLAFLLAGIALWLNERRSTRLGPLVFSLLALAVSAIGIGGIVGHFVGLEALYQVASYNPLLPTTAFGLSVVGAGLWMLHEAAHVFDPKRLQTTEQRIKRRSIAVITLVALAGGVAGFSVMRGTFERSVSKDMLLIATTNATSLAHTIEVSLLFPKNVATRPAARQALDKLSKTPADTDAMDFLQRVAESALTADLTRVEIYAANGARVAQAGPVPPKSQVIQRLANTEQTTFLAWKDGYLLLAEAEVRIDGRIVGRVFTEQRMPLFDRLLAEIRASSDTSDAAICGRDNDKMVCAPNRYRPSGLELPMFDATGAAALPVARALLGEHGVQFLKDRRGTNVLSAFTPIKDFGLGLAVRTNVDTLYAPMKSRLNILAVALVAIVALAIYAQQHQVRPVLKQLVASEQMVKAIVENQSELVSLATPDGELTYVNPAYARHFGRTPADMLGDSMYDYIEPADHTAVRKVVADVLSTGTTATNENRVTSAQGAQRWVAWTNRLLSDPSGRPTLHSVGRDVTERVLAERALRTLAAIFDATTDYVIQNDAQGRLIYMNPAARRRVGLAPDAPIEQLTLAHFNPPQTLAKFNAEVGPSAAATGVWVGESLVWDAERREFPVSHIVICHRDAQGKVEYFSALMRDISAAKAAEQAVRDSEHRLRLVTDNMPALISYLDRDLRFRFVNRTYQQWFGSEAAPQAGMSAEDFFGEQARLEIGPWLRAALDGQDVAVDREMMRPEGRRHVQVTVVPDRDEQGSVFGLYTLINDVTSYRESQRALQESEARLRTVADALPMRVAYIDAGERYRFNNLAYERGFGRPRHELHGQTVRAVLGETAYQAVEPHIRSALRGEPVTFQSEMDSNGSYVCYEAQYIPQRAADGSTVLGFHAVVTDITRQKLEEKRLTELARVDALSGLINRAGFELRMAEAMQRSRTSGALIALMYLDIDHFKQINDRYGHHTGDALLRGFAGRLSQAVRSTDTVARLGGDEFTVIMEGLPRPEVASTVAGKIVQAMSSPFVVEQQAISITTSIGLAFYQGDATTVEALVRQADVMLYQAKGAGRNNVQVALRLIEGGRA